MKSIQVENTKVGNISEEDIKSVLNNLDVNAYLKQNFILFICDKNDIESYKKEVIKRFISRMRRDYMMVYIFIILISIIILMLLPLFNEGNEVGYTFTVRIFSLLVTVCLIYLSYFLWNNTFTSNIRQWWSAFFLVNYIALYFIMFLFLDVLFLANLSVFSKCLKDKVKDIFLLYCGIILIILCLGSLIVFFYFIPNNCEHEDSDLQKVLSKLEEIEKTKRLEK